MRYLKIYILKVNSVKRIDVKNHLYSAPMSINSGIKLCKVNSDSRSLPSLKA